MAIYQVGDHIVNDSGVPPVHTPADTEDSARDLANALYRSGNFPAGLDACFTSGINGDWDDYGGICPFWGQDICSCDEGVIEVFHEMLEETGVTVEQWHAMNSDEKQNAVFQSRQ